MDPNATFDVVMDVDADYDERLDALENLRDWLASGGFGPDDLDDDDLACIRGMDPHDFLASVSDCCRLPNA